MASHRANDDDDDDDDDDEDNSHDTNPRQLLHYSVNGDQTALSAEERQLAEGLDEAVQRSIDGHQAEEEDEAEVEDDADDDLLAAALATEKEATDQEKQLANNLEAKSMVHLARRVPKRKTAKASPCWDYFSTFELRPGLTDKDLRDKDPVAADKLLESKQEEKHLFVCNACYDDPKKTLCDCIRSGGNNGPGNLTKHLEKHRAQYAEYCIAANIINVHAPAAGKASNKASITPKKRRASSSQTSVSVSAPGMSSSNKSMKVSSGASPHSLTIHQQVSVDSSLTNPSCIESPINKVFIVRNHQLGDAHCKEHFQYLIHRFATHNNIPARAITDFKNCPEFKELMLYTMENGPQLRRLKDAIPGKYMFNKHRKTQYNTLLGAVDQYVGETRDWYKKTLAKPEGVPFGIVAQDVWDSKNQDCLGVTFSFYSPPRGTYFSIPLGLMPNDDKKAAATTIQTLDLLTNAGILKADLYKAVNDTTNTAVKIGRDLVGESGGCAMHEVSLAFEHGIGKRMRSKNKVVIDSFPAAEDIRKKSLWATGELMEKKAKSRFRDFTKQMAECSRKVIRIIQPNSTRAAGVYLHYETVIMMRWCLYFYWLSKEVGKMLTDADFWLIAQLLSVMYPMSVLIKLVQTDRPGAIAFTFFYIFRAYVAYCTAIQWWVAETRIEKTPEKTMPDRWDGNASFPVRDYQGEPVEGKKAKKQTIRMVPIETKKLHPIAQKMIKRLAKELLQYGAKPTPERLLAMSVHPMMAVHGIAELEVLVAVLKEAVGEEEVGKLGMDLDFATQAKKTLIAEVRSLCCNILPKEGDKEPATSANVVPAATGGTSHLNAMRRKMRQENSKAKATEQVSDPVEKQVEEFFAQYFDPRIFLPGKLTGNTEVEWIENWETIAQHFDVFNWWETVGKDLYPLIYPVACRILSLPDSNGGQERTFSAATWMDGKLVSKQSDMTFQMKVLLYKNKNFMAQHKIVVKEEKKALAELRTRDLLKKTLKKATDKDIDDDLEGVIDAYDLTSEEVEDDE